MSEPGGGTERASRRIQLIDAARGLSIILMVAYHTGYDLVAAGLMSQEILYNPLLNTLEPLFAGVFITLSGVSACYARDNRRRGLRVLGCALLVSFVTGFMGAGTAISFGILHCLGLCMILGGDPAVWQGKLPRWLQPWLFGGLFVVCYAVFPLRGALFAGVPYLEMLGLIGPEYGAPDYFPLLPWFFLYLFGTWAGGHIKAGDFPRWFYKTRVPVLPVVGRYTLLIYMLHQPVIFGVVSVIAGMGKG
ncbi:MAG: DUF1624 domain-containing protein [Oscillospiraceae bacterium]|jgi:uncharacterized membrane protein|nr:DUF1624 domain-containing protein [Oscillospiraceae bacterium]